ncbi:CHST9 [Mytilus edulis]|uniref:Carbohydrate sulfotransferase n=1 Tax=Mytilus edulis TaxID=6550 RepID=A0A8S3R5U7_MYTED|nr:CHST9 [Mytilus edulis]
MLHMELYNRTWLPWSQNQSAIYQSKELTNPTFSHWTRHLPGNRPTKQMPNGHKTCKHKLDKKIIEQLEYNPSSPIVVPKYKLIFFWSAKSACTYWKRLMQFIQGINKTILHDPRSGLKNLNMFNKCTIMEMMHDEQWLKAVFVREPRERILSSYLDKGQHRHVMYEVCKINRTVSFNEFLEIIKHCKNSHWDNQCRVPGIFL